MIGAVDDMKRLETQLQQASESLKDNPRFNRSTTLPIGVGLLPFILKTEQALAVLKKSSPAVVWLFAAKQIGDYAQWASDLRKTCPNTQIWIQIGSISGALELVQSCRPDALIMQGADAGGHGFEKGAGIISLLPEARDSLSKNGFGDISLLASGGIVDGRSAASAFALGADGVVMGKRFLAAKEVTIHPKYQAAVLAAEDGGQATVRAKVFDELRGPNMWPKEYDGRSIMTNSYLDHANGVSIEQIRDLHKQALAEKDLGWGTSNRATVWAGTGVGLVTKVEPAADIVDEVRRESRMALDAARSRL